MTERSRLSEENEPRAISPGETVRSTGDCRRRRPATSDVTGVNVGIRSAANLFAAEFEAAMEARSIGKNEFHTPGPGEVLFSTLIKGSSVWFGL